MNPRAYRSCPCGRPVRFAYTTAPLADGAWPRLHEILVNRLRSFGHQPIRGRDRWKI